MARRAFAMQRMQRDFSRIGLSVWLFVLLGLGNQVQGDLIRPKTVRTYPDIAGDIVGSQTYTFDPASKTGVFLVTSAPQFIALGPGGGDTASVTPDQEGTLSQELQLKLDQNGHVVDNPENRFQLYGTVVLGNQVFRGLLLEGRPTDFGAQLQNGRFITGRDVFDLNVRITGGKLAAAFGPEAYLRIMPQANSTFNGSFAANFSGERPLTSLRALQKRLPWATPEPAPLVIMMTAGTGLAARWLRRRHRTRHASRSTAKSQSQRDACR
jgi:hypothetical protein